MKSDRMHYIATPYSHDDPEVRRYRHDVALAIVAECTRLGELAISPVVHSCAVADELASKGVEVSDFDDWRDWCLCLLDRCDVLVVAKVDGWRESVGVAAEIEHAKRYGKPIVYRDVKIAKREPAEAGSE